MEDADITSKSNNLKRISPWKDTSGGVEQENSELQSLATADNQSISLGGFKNQEFESGL